MHLAFFHRAIGRGFLDVDLDDVADAGVTLVAANTPMFQAILAPVLSATSKLDRTCNINLKTLIRPATAAVSCTPRSTTSTASSVSTWTAGGFPRCARCRRLRLGLFVVRVKFLVGRDDLLELRVRETAFHAHHDGLGHLVGDDFADALFALAGRRSQDLVASAIQNYFAPGFGLVAQCRDAGFHAGDVLAQRAQARGLFQLRARLLQAQVEHFLPQVAALGRQLHQRQIFDFGNFIKISLRDDGAK
jgi:hypothetical protein